MAWQDPSLQEGSPRSAQAAPPRRMTEEEFVAWCDEDARAEWVDGDVVMASPPSVEHVDLSGWLTSILRIVAEQRGLGRVLHEIQVRLAPQRRRRVSDIVFLAKERQQLLRSAHVEGPPDLIVEIVSPESEGRDWREKYLEYEAAGVREYWVIDPMSQHVEAYALAEQTGPPHEKQREYRRLQETGGILRSTVLTGFHLKTAWLWPSTRPAVLDALHALGVGGLSPEP